MKRIRKSRVLSLESLENRHLLSVDGVADADLFDPSALEQEMLEHLNRMRMAPQAELDILFTDVESATARDPDARLAMTVYQDPSPEEIAEDWARLSSVPPLAWNESLFDAAFDHTNLMVQYDDQSHLLPGELSVPQRLAAAGYPAGSAVGENVFAYMNSVFHGHSAFSIDWKVPDRSHRDNMMASTFREVGISIVAEDNPDSQVGPLLVTQDYGDGRGMEDSYLLGVAWDDLNENGWYDAGEGFSDVELLIEGTGGTYTATTMTAGGYQTLVPDGLYTVTAYGGQLPSPMIVRDVLIGDENVKVDFEYDPDQSLDPLVDLNGPAETGVDYQTTFYEGSLPIPIVALDGFVEDEDSEQLVSLTATITNLLEPGEYLIADTTGTPISGEYDALSGILTLSGAASVAEYGQVLATLGYGHAGSAIKETPRVIEVIASDGTNYSTPAKATVGVQATLPKLMIADLVVKEGDSGVSRELAIQLSRAVPHAVAVDLATLDGSATAGDDYTPIQQTIQFAPGETVKTVPIGLVDDETPESEESYSGHLSNPVGATIANGVATITIVDDDVVTDLDEVDFVGMQGVDLTSESSLYRLTTKHDGILSVQVAGDSESEISLVLYDQDRSSETVITAVSTDGVARFDLPSVSAGETYYLEVTGTATEADVLVGNVVQQDGSTLVVGGTSDDDVFSFEAGETLAISINGLSYSYSWEEAESVAFLGGEGNDQANLTGSATDDVATLFPGHGRLSGQGYTVTLEETEAIEVAGAGGSDTVKLYDSPGDDTLVVDGDVGTLSGAGFANSATEFGSILAYATYGGDDSAELTGTEDYDEFIGKPTVSKVVSADQYLRTKYFDHVTVLGNGGDDFARIYGDEGVEHFVGGPNVGEMVGEGFHYRVEGYLSVHGYSRGKTGDTAVLSDSPGDDTLVTSPMFAKIYGEGFLTRAKFFPTIEIVASEGFDAARLYDSEGNDEAVIAAAESTISGPDYARQVRGFDRVVAYSQEGGLDVASLYDTPGNDSFVAQVGAATLVGDEFLGYAYGFGDVRVHATAGGIDTATLYDSTGADELRSYANASSISGSGYFIRAEFFETVEVLSVLGGYDTARFYGGDSDSVFRGNLSFSTMDEAGYHRRAEAFEAVYAEAGSGIDTAIFEGADGDGDLFEAGDDWGRLRSTTLGTLVEARQFEFMSGPSNDDETTA